MLAGRFVDPVETMVLENANGPAQKSSEKALGREAKPDHPKQTHQMNATNNLGRMRFDLYTLFVSRCFK